MKNLNDIFFAPAEDSSLTYDQILEDVQRYFSENHASTIAGAGDGDTQRASSVLKELMVQYLVKRRIALQGFPTEELCAKLYEDMAGYSFLKKWIYAPDVEEVNINAYNDIEVIMNSGRSIKIPERFSSPQHAIDVVRRMLNACGMVINDTMPSVIGFLDRNIRISVDKTPIVDADVGVNASIRIVNQQTVSEEKLLETGSATAEMLHFLTACIRYGVSVCIAGSTGSGKTTIMAWLLSNVPNNRRLITIEEESREFDLVKRDAEGNILNSVVHLLTRPHENPTMNIDQDFLLERVLRKHPDVIGVGEMRSAAESLSAAESSRTGHTVCTTIHSNSCESTYRRMMTLAKRKYAMDDSILMQIMVEAYPVVVFTKQLEDRSRKIMEIIEGEDYVDGKLLYRSLYKYHVEDNVTDSDGNARVVGHHQKAETISATLQKRLLDNGIPNRELEEFLKPEPLGQKTALKAALARKPAPARTGGIQTATVRRIGGKVSPIEEKHADIKPPAETAAAMPEVT
nr:CpaF/VirB11 family protein [uncultured Acetatifactor sp.]